MNTQNTPNRTPNPATALVRRLLTVTVLLATVLVALAPGASAAPIEDIEILDIHDIELPTPLDIDDIVMPTPVVAVDAEVTCTDEAAVEITIDNNTLQFVPFEVLINDVLVDFSVVSPTNEYTGTYPVEENTTAHVEVNGLDPLFADELDVDCLSPDPWFEFIANCDLGQAWVELGNHGPDGALMGVHYTDLPHAPGFVAPGTSHIQPLAVEPNEFADFAIEVDFEPIYTDGFFFDCPVPEPQPEPEPEDGADEDVDAEDNAPEEVDGEDIDAEGGKDTDQDDENAEEATETPDDVIEGTTVEVSTDGDVTELGADELALAADLETGETSTGTSIMIALLIVFGLVMVVGSATAMKLRR